MTAAEAMTPLDSGNDDSSVPDATAHDAAPEASAPDGSLEEAGGKDGGMDATVDGPIFLRKRVFVTSDTWDGDLSSAGNGTGADPGADGADQLCTTAASDAGLGGLWRAWVSTSGGSSAGARLADVGPWYLLDQSTLVFANKAAMAPAPVHAIDMDETGTPVVGNYPVWTGTQKSGQVMANATCMDWTSNDSGDLAVEGQAGATGSAWTNDGTVPTCDNGAALCCFEQ